MLVLPILEYFCYLYIFQCTFGGLKWNRKPRPKNNSLDCFCLRHVLFDSLYSNPLLVGSNGIEPSTSRLSGVRSNHLSYEPIY